MKYAQLMQNNNFQFKYSDSEHLKNHSKHLSMSKNRLVSLRVFISLNIFPQNLFRIILNISLLSPLIKYIFNSVT